MRRTILSFVLILTSSAGIYAAERDSRVREYVYPTRIVWQHPQGQIANTKKLFSGGLGQAVFLTEEPLCVMQSVDGAKPSILLDFGREIHGGVQIVTGMSPENRPAKLRIRFGESASEAMCDIDGDNGATNDHAMRDFELTVPWLGMAEAGNSGFRFVRIDLLEDNYQLLVSEIRAVSSFRDIPYKGSFACNDERLNQIWKTGAYTVI